MPRTPCSSQPLVDLIRERKVVMYADLQNALGAVSRQTVYRKMLEIGVRSSYSHGGRYYTMDECADYDTNGLWSYGEIHFSRYNTLNDTLVYLVDQSPRGLRARDLKQIVKLEVLTVLHRLTKAGRMFRTKIGDHYVYFSTNTDRRRRQRHRLTAPPILGTTTFVEAVQRFCGTLNEKQLRLFAGLEALRADSGGDRKVADLLGMSRTTVTKGREQLLSGDFEKNRIRKPGGGRKSIEKKTEFNEHFARIVEGETAGDPIHGTCWVRMTAAGIAKELGLWGIQCSDTTVRRVLLDWGFKQRMNWKMIAITMHQTVMGSSN